MHKFVCSPFCDCTTGKIMLKGKITTTSMDRTEEKKTQQEHRCSRWDKRAIHFNRYSVIIKQYY